MAFSWKASKKFWKELELSDAVCDAEVMLELYWEIICDLLQFFKQHCLTTEIHIMYIGNTNESAGQGVELRCHPKSQLFMSHVKWSCVMERGGHGLGHF